MSGKPHRSGWLVEEDSILLNNYVKCGIHGCLKYLPYRTKASIRKRARKLGLSRRYVRNQDPAAYEPDDYRRYMRAQTKLFANALKAAGYG